MTNNGLLTVSLPFQNNPALYQDSGLDQVALTLIGQIPRNATQLEELQKVELQLKTLHQGLGTYPFVHQCGLYQVKCQFKQQPPADYTFTSIDGERVFQEYLYLFNVIIALEWNPSLKTLQQIRLCAKQASNFLYDVTNGFMALGQVVIGGPDLMNAADIQIMCSNRLHPRAWVDALNKAEKFSPIRIGRGVWQKNSGKLATWDSPEGYRALIHEWGHYAYGLADEYLAALTVRRAPDTNEVRAWTVLGKNDLPDNADVEMVVPEIALPLDSVMADAQISEYAPRDKIFAQINARYPYVPKNPKHLDGPAELPLLLPQFRDIEGMEPSSDPVLHTAHLSQAKGWNENGTHWIYLLKSGPNNTPDNVIAQGKLGQQDLVQGLPILGGEAGDRIVIVSQIDETVLVLSAPLLLSAEPPQQLIAPMRWDDVTPAQLQDSLAKEFFVDVIPGPVKVDETLPPRVPVKVEVTTTPQPDEIYLYPLGASLSPRGGLVASDWQEIPHLDGLVFLRWQSGMREQIFICSYSLGGGPGTSGGGRLPITAGSSDGNAMCFFLDNAINQRNPDGSRKKYTRESLPQGDDPGVRIVTTTLTVGPQTFALENGTTVEARSYIFGLASNESLQPYPATLVLYFDAGARKHGGDLVIYHWENTWKHLTTYMPSDLSYVAIPLRYELGSAPTFFADAGRRVEHYRIFWTPT